MADGTQLSAAVGVGVVAASDDVGGFQYQRVKISQGVDGVVDGDVSAALPLPTRASGGTAAVTSVASSAASQTMLAAAATRTKAILYNDTDKTCWVKYGTTASAASFTKKLLPQQDMEVLGYSGRIDAIWGAAPTGNMLITEITP